MPADVRLPLFPPKLLKADLKISMQVTDLFKAIARLDNSTATAAIVSLEAVKDRCPPQEFSGNLRKLSLKPFACTIPVTI